MKKAVLIIGLLTLWTLGAQASQVECKYKASDLPNPIVGKGQTVHEAHSKAVEQCFDRRVAMYESARGSIDMDRGMDFIDACVNLRCQ